MPLPKWQMEENARKCRRTCEVCGAPFRVKYPSTKTRTCSAKCFGKLNSALQTGRKQSPETSAKRSASLAAWNERNPDASRARIEAATSAYAAWLADPANAERIAENAEISRQLMRTINEKHGETSKIILKRAHQELRAETDYCAVFAEVQEMLRRELPYDGPKEGSDYADYLQKLGRATVAHPRCQEIVSSYMSEAIPRISRDVRTAQGIEAREGGDGTAPREAREPGPKDAPKRSSHETRRA